MEESSWARASKDTEKFRKDSGLWFLGVEVVGGGAIAALTAWILWDRSTLHGWQVGVVTFIVFVIGLLLIYCFIFLWNLIRAPYKQRNGAWRRIKELEAEAIKPKPFDVICSTTSLGLPINQLSDGSYQASSMLLGINPILIMNRGDLTTITHFIMSPVITFNRPDGWETTDAIRVTPGHNGGLMTTLLTQTFTWDIDNPQQWILKGLPLSMAKGDKLTLPRIWVSVTNGNDIGIHFEKKEICTLLMRFAIRTDKGVPTLPDHQISLTMNTIKNPLSGFDSQPKLEEGTTQ